MNIKRVCIIGLKVLAAAAAGFAVWASFSNNKTNNNTEGCRGHKSHENGEGDKRENKELQISSAKKKGAEVVSGLKKFQDTCGKIFSVAQSLATVGENLYRIFNGGNNPYQQSQGGRCGDGPAFTRVTANIIEAGWNPNPSSPWGPNQSKYWL